ncbi:hypothetical protein [Ponticoccus litoralis]|uniref:DUF4145 domain-containing protein n=1 Tax=Ponticoccus litoralis TaxID=422297 RepID=A0AAW9SLS7_9RHOB
MAALVFVDYLCRILRKDYEGVVEDIGWKLFVVQMVVAVAWPAAFVIVAFGFRKELKALLSRLKALKVSGAEVGFSELLDEASREAAVIPTMQTPSAMIDIDEEVVSKHPHFAVIEAWRAIEAEVSSLMKVVDPALPRHEINGFRSLRMLRKTELIPSEVLELLEDLRRIRNAAVHDEEPNITKGQALEFLSIASRVEDALKRARGSLPSKSAAN